MRFAVMEVFCQIVQKRRYTGANFTELLLGLFLPFAVSVQQHELLRIDESLEVIDELIGFYCSRIIIVNNFLHPIISTIQAEQ